MGALEFVPALGPGPARGELLDLPGLVGVADLVLNDRAGFTARLTDEPDRASGALLDLLRLGTSAGGARAKAVVAWNPTTGELRSGQVDAGAGFTHWPLKFDGVHGNRGRWSLAPAIDVTYAYNPDRLWTGQHQMSLNGKRDGFRRSDFAAVGKTAALRRGRALAILDEVVDAVRGWSEHAETAGVDAETTVQISRAHRLDLG